jgi:hypothetical protein
MIRDGKDWEFQVRNCRPVALFDKKRVVMADQFAIRSFLLSSGIVTVQGRLGHATVKDGGGVCMNGT